MKKLWGVALCAIALSLLGVSGVRAVTYSDITIRSFEADYYLSRDANRVAEMRTVERIIIEVPPGLLKHGIFRYIPEIYKDHSLETKVLSVKDSDDTAWQYSTESSGDNLMLKIGDPDKYLEAGEHTYLIEYTTRGVISQQPGHQEFYWDVNGNEWGIGMGSVSARLHLTEDVAAGLQPEKTCFAGAYGITAGDVIGGCAISIDSARRIVTTSNILPLGPGETLTMAVKFADNTFAEYQPSLEERLKALLAIGAVVGPPLLALVVSVLVWRKRGRDPKGRGVIVPQYLPPKDVTVLGSSAVLKEGFDRHAVSATILDLAVRHYLKVYEHREDKLFKDKITYEVEIVKDLGDLKADEREALEMVFGKSGTSVGSKANISELPKDTYVKAKRLGEHVDHAMTATGYFASNPTKAKHPFTIIGTVLMFIGLFVGHWLVVGLLFAGLILLAAAAAMPARTLKGVELREYLLGLKEYMQLAEAERLRMLQSPAGDLTEKVDVGDKRQLVKLYERLLPYAMLFGIEKEWAKQFASLYDEQPDWYSGSAAFNAAYFSSAIGTIGTTASQAFAPPSSSSGSGFGGGGFAGGGGGGGGGGSW